MKNDNKRKNIFWIVLSIVLVLAVICLIIYILFDKNVINIHKKEIEVEEKKEIKISDSEEDLMFSIADVIYNNEDELTITDIDNQDKLNIVSVLLKKNLTELKGKEIIDTYHKYFGEDSDIILDNYVCPGSYNTNMSGIHQNNARYLYIYNEDTDTYVYNDEHLGHGSGVSSEIAKNYKYIISSKIEDNKYLLNLKIYFIKNPCMGDTCIGLPNDVKIYKRYNDVENENDYIVDASINTNYCSVNKDVSSEYSKFYDCDYDKIYEGVKKDLDTYTFEFIKENNNLVFKRYYLSK